VRAVAAGIGEFDPGALQTAHGAPGKAVADYWQGEAWLQINNVYTYEPIPMAALSEYARPEHKPFLLIESRYENDNGIAERGLRAQAYQAILCGAAGQVFGNNPIWHFHGPGLSGAPTTWEEALDSPGARSMTHLRELMATVPWWLLEPDTANAFLVDGRGPMEARAVAALTSDRPVAILYLPASRAVTVDLWRLAGRAVVARWYDPADGRFVGISGSPFPASGLRRLKPERASNASGFNDWVLLLEASS
jgi:Protein of unknown function (DUF4038)/Putative collagen-binding domain of a collagenase